MTPQNGKLLDAAREARSHAYAPYSNFTVGAALELEDGSIISGCNVENASYGLSICAERVAITRAVAEGHRRFRALAIAGPPDASTAPCGACRQFIFEFAPQLSIEYTDENGSTQTTIEVLLPEAFGPDSLP